MKELEIAEDRRAAAALEVIAQPDDGDARRRLEAAEEKVARKLAAYDSSPRGQFDLRSAIATTDDHDSPDHDELRTRLAVGRITRVEQKCALARARGGEHAEEQRETEKALRRLRHPEPPTGIEGAPALGFYVQTSDSTQRFEDAGDARHAAAHAGASSFYDAQTGNHVALYEGEQR